VPANCDSTITGRMRGGTAIDIGLSIQERNAVPLKP
jgi:hypothetical protein